MTTLAPGEHAGVGGLWMTGPMDTWSERDLPVLQAIVQGYDENGVSPDTEALSQTTGLDEVDIKRAIRALEHEDPPYLLAVMWGGANNVWSSGTPTGHARRAVGAWPTVETVAARLIKGLTEAADAEQDAETAGWLMKTAHYLGSAGRDVGINIAATVINRQLGM